MNIQKKEAIQNPEEKSVIDTGKRLDKIPFFSVCIPTYNRASFLPQAIDSVLSQDFTDFELIICDNASTDNTQEVVENYSYQDKRIRYVRYRDLVSMYANHNRCIDLAQAEWLIFLHSDDNFEKNALFICQKFLYKLDNIKVLYPASQVHSSIVNWDQEPLTHYIINKPHQLYRYPAGTPSGACYKTTIFKQVKFDEKSICGDLDILIKITKNKYKIAIIDQEIVKIGTNASNRYTNTWHLSGNFIKDVSACLTNNLDDSIFQEILLDVNNWTPKEISLLILFFTYQGKLNLVKKMESKISDKSYRKQREYRHVIVAKFLGYTLYKFFYSAIKKSRSLSA